MRRQRSMSGKRSGCSRDGSEQSRSITNDRLHNKRFLERQNSDPSFQTRGSFRSLKNCFNLYLINPFQESINGNKRVEQN